MSDRVIIGGFSFPVEVALTAEEKQKGLMFRSEGSMAFPFEDQQIRHFWMHQVAFPLDLIFVNQGRIVDLQQGQALSPKILKSKQACDLVIELPAGMIKQYHFQVNNLVRMKYSLPTLMRKWATHNGF